MNIEQKSSEIPIKERIDGVIELEELIELAAKISNNIDSLQRKCIDRLYHIIICIFGILMVSVFLFYGSKYMKLSVESAGLLPILAISFTLPFVLYLFKSIVDRTRLIEEIYFESLILDDLFNKLHTHKETVFIHLGILQKEIFILKLNRIKFSLSTTFSKRKNSDSTAKRVIDFV